jgi:hypothetical protein
MFRTGYRKLKDLFSAMNGGEPMSDQWGPDAHLRAAVRNMKTDDIAKMEGGLFLDDLREFLLGLDVITRVVTRDTSLAWSYIKILPRILYRD